MKRIFGKLFRHKFFSSSQSYADKYFRYTRPEDLHDTDDRLGAIGRIGSLSLVIFSIISFVASVILPPLIRSPESSSSPKLLSSKKSPIPSFLVTVLKYVNDRKPSLLSAWFVSHLIFAGANFLAPFVTSLGLANFVVALSGLPWALALWAPFAFMGVEINRLTTPESADTVAVDGTTLTNANGAAYQPAPVEDEEEDALKPGEPFDESKLAHSPEPASPIELHITHNHTPLHSPREAGSDAASNDEDRDSEDEDLELNTALGANGFLTHDDPLTTDASTGETAGVYLGILNLYAAAPQLLGTLINFVVFAIVEPGKSRELAGDSEPPHSHENEEAFGVVNGTVTGMEAGRLVRGIVYAAMDRRDHADEGTPQGVNAIAVCMFIGGLSSLGAAYATWRLKHVR